MNNLKTLFLMVLMAALMIFVGGLVGGRSGMMIMLVISLAMNAYTYWCSDSLVLRSSGAQEVTREEAPQLYDLVERLAQRAGLPTPRVCIIDTDVPNAFATGRDPSHAAVAVTTGIMRVLDYNELSGVLAHELSHVKNRDILTSTIVAMMATVISYVAQFFAFFGGGSDDEGESGNILVSLAVILLAPLAALLIQMAVSRSREYEADKNGGEICGNPNYLADALEKIDYYARNAAPLPEAQPATAHMYIVNPFEGTGKAITKLFSTHPETSDRIARLHEQAREMRVR